MSAITFVCSFVFPVIDACSIVLISFFFFFCVKVGADSFGFQTGQQQISVHRNRCRSEARERGETERGEREKGERERGVEVMRKLLIDFFLVCTAHAAAPFTIGSTSYVAIANNQVSHKLSGTDRKAGRAVRGWER